MSLSVAFALSGLGGDDNLWGGDFGEFYRKGEMLFPNGIPKSPSVSSIASTASSSSRYSSESGIASMSDLGNSYQALEELIDNVFDEQGFRMVAPKIKKILPSLNYPLKKDEEDKDKSVTVMYQGRDLLDLYKNISGNSYTRSNSAVLACGIGTFYFENRSQYSRLQGARPPPHAILSCPDCSFTESKYD
ncbi:PREDICTED: uncharacterized protein LOC108565627 [Nicrophorus vespilloides]|uniref:Uncharacterized protein LOC108565627 n=1 Tax=Nicrophorus vespilloides TaxID=110193 RepID=A0ABM1N1H5_NICVS|nr:PREDICTED: uncharacterized protein LOC108565627 [Nicrophorus vespilloides]